MPLRPLLWIVFFQAVATPVSDLKGRIVLTTGTVDGYLTLSCGGRVGAESAGIVVIDQKVPMFTKFGSVTWDDANGLTFHYKNLPRGACLLTASWSVRIASETGQASSRLTHYLDWRWVEVKPPDPKETSAEVVLSVDPSVCGDVQVTLAPGVAAESVSFMPADNNGRVPDWASRRNGAAHSEKVIGGKALFKGMKPGKYVFYPTLDLLSTEVPSLLSVAEVKAKSVVQVAIGDTKK